jgi:hypothetical protein
VVITAGPKFGSRQPRLIAGRVMKRQARCSEASSGRASSGQSELT